MIGRFEHRKNCSLPHYIPQGESKDGHPVIVFPKEPGKIVVGKLYEFLPMMTRDATYTVGDVVYRVAHAIGVVDAEGKEGGLVDLIMHGGAPAPISLAGRLDPDTLRKLEALKTRRA